MIASQVGHTDIVRLLLDEKSDVNASNTNGDTPLYLASKNGKIEIVKQLSNTKVAVNVIKRGFKKTRR